MFSGVRTVFVFDVKKESCWRINLARNSVVESVLYVSV